LNDFDRIFLKTKAMDKRQIQVAVPITGEEEVTAIREVVLSGQFVSGGKVAEFEKEFAEFIGVSDAAAVNSGTAALHVALAVLGVGPGDEVIVPPITFMSTVTAVLHQNAKPIFADIDPTTFCISPADIRRRITPRTRAIIPVHLFGNASDMGGVMELAEEFNLFVIEDCAQAHGTEYKGKKVGSIGHLGAFSFFATKHMTTGEGGILTSNNKQWIENAKVVRNHGMVNRDDHVCLGYNYRMNEIAAAMGLVQLKKLAALNRKRVQNSLYLLNALTKDRRTWFFTAKGQPDVNHTFFWCPLIINTADGYTTKDVVERLKKEGIEVRQRYQRPLYHQALIQDCSPYPGGCPFDCRAEVEHQNYRNLSLPNAEALAGNIIGLPNHPGLTRDDLDYIVNTILNLY
jgi:perosamine synthetase